MKLYNQEFNLNKENRLIFNINKLEDIEEFVESEFSKDEKASNEKLIILYEDLEDLHDKLSRKIRVKIEDLNLNEASDEDLDNFIDKVYEIIEDFDIHQDLKRVRGKISKLRI